LSELNDFLKLFFFNLHLHEWSHTTNELLEYLKIYFLLYFEHEYNE